MNNTCFWVFFCCLLGCIFSFSDMTFARGKLTDDDLKKLPELCSYTWYGITFGEDDYGTLVGSGGIEKSKDKSPAHQRLYYFYKKYGRDLLHMHHYCTALQSLNESATSCGTSTQCREGKIKSAIGDFTYILKNSSQKV